jgi:hypothetical protein
MRKTYEGKSRLGSPSLDGDNIKVDRYREGAGWFNLVQDMKLNEFAGCREHCNEQ